MNKKGIFLKIVVILILLVVGFFWFISDYDSSKPDGFECVPVECCHASECVWAEEVPDCEGVVCTMDCEPETMDCGQGYCEVVSEKCEVVWNE